MCILNLCFRHSGDAHGQGGPGRCAGDVGVGGSFTRDVGVGGLHLASQRIEVQRSLERGGRSLRTNTMMGDSGSICGKSKRLRLAIMAECGKPGREVGVFLSWFK